VTPPRSATTTSTRPFWIGLAVGAPILAFGVRGILEHADETKPAELARWILGSALVHDGIVLPAVVVVGWAGRRACPSWAWPATRWALATTAIVLAVSRPFVARWGYRAANPTALSRDYGAGTAVAVAAIWAVALAWAVRDARRRERLSRPGGGGAPG
jgi:hypothetical protein